MAETDEASSPEKQDKVEIKRIRSENYTLVYSNQVQIGMSPYDFQFVFGRLFTTEENETYVEELVSILMSPQHALAMILPMLNMVIQYERQYGSINLPQDSAVAAGTAALKEFMAQVIKAIKEAPAEAFQGVLPEQGKVGGGDIEEKE